MSRSDHCTAFAGHDLLATGDRASVAVALRRAQDAGLARLVVFDDETGRQIDFDLRGSDDEIIARLNPMEPPARTGRGRPKLGVIPREVTLLPRHWEWLAEQPGGASATLRRLIDEARKSHVAKRDLEAAYRLMSGLAGDLPGFEAASRALYAGDAAALAHAVQSWPKDVADYLGPRLSAAVEPD